MRALSSYLFFHTVFRLCSFSLNLFFSLTVSTFSHSLCYFLPYASTHSLFSFLSLYPLSLTVSVISYYMLPLTLCFLFSNCIHFLSQCLLFLTICFHSLFVFFSLTVSTFSHSLCYFLLYASTHSLFSFLSLSGPILLSMFFLLFVHPFCLYIHSLYPLPLPSPPLPSQVVIPILESIEGVSESFLEIIKKTYVLTQVHTHYYSHPAPILTSVQPSPPYWVPVYLSCCFLVRDCE